MKSKKKYLPEALFDGEDPEWVGMRLLVVLGWVGREAIEKPEHQSSHDQGTEDGKPDL